MTLDAEQLVGLEERVARRGSRWGGFVEDVAANLGHSRGAVVHGVMAAPVDWMNRAAADDSQSRQREHGRAQAPVRPALPKH